MLAKINVHLLTTPKLGKNTLNKQVQLLTTSQSNQWN